MKSKMVYIPGRSFDDEQVLQFYPQFSSYEDAKTFAFELGFDTVFVCLTW